MFRRSTFILALVVLLSGLATASARPYTWTAWLHYGRHMTLVNSAGESLREVELPTIQGYDIQPGIAISHDGNVIAYILHAPDAFPEHIMIYNSVEQILLLDYLLPDYAETSRLTSNNFNETDTALAIGYDLFNIPDESESWLIQTIDIATGHVSNQLHSSELNAQLGEPLWSSDTYHQVVAYYENSKVSFVLYPDDGSTQSYGFVWNTVTYTVDEDISRLGDSYDTFDATKEVVGVFPSTDFKHFTLQFYDPVLHARYPFYAGNGWSKKVQFVQNGERILVTAYDTNSLSLIERNGKTVSEWNMPPDFVFETMMGIPDGFLYTAIINQSSVGGNVLAIPELLAVNTLNNQLGFGQVVWHLSFEEFRKQSKVDYPGLEIVWEHDDAPVPIYEAWAQLAAPVYEPTPATPQNLPLPTMIPTPEPLFRVGMTVHVQTTGGEILNLRTDHTRKADVIMYLTNKMALTLLEGPVQVEGFNWWRVRTPDGKEGWTVENNGDLQTLIPG